MSIPCSVMILTLNEEINIKQCIDSVSWCDDLVVFDSHSKDKTVQIAQELGARVIKRKFDNWSAHQNWAMKNIEFKHPWVLYIDADEKCTDKLGIEIDEVLKNANDISAFRLRRKDFFMGKWLKHAQLYPTWIVRLFRPEKIYYERLVNPIAVVDGETRVLEGHLHHYPFSHGVTHWVARHNSYSDMEAIEALKVEDKQPIAWKDCLNSDPNIRRKFLKNIFFLLPARPFIKFIYYLIVRRGFLDGYPGFNYCVLQAIYEYFIMLKTKELKMQRSGQPL